MIKYIDISPYDMNGDPTTREVGSYHMEKIAKYETLMGEMQEYIANIKPKKGKAFLLIAAMGDQNWGPNRNADFWPTEALAHEGHDYGYLTFEDNGHWYHQHNNKDPKNSYGKVIKSIYNPQMCRIELIVEVDTDKDNITREKLDRNELIEVSMGARVGYDVCKVCHPSWMEFYKIPEPDMVKIAASTKLSEVHDIGKKHGVDLSYIKELNPDGGPIGIHSKISKYCHHMRYSKNKLLPSGERVCVINLRPKFFDISEVNVNADKSAFVLDKVASEETEDTLMERLAANEKKAKEEKKADISKEVPGEVISDKEDAIKEYYATKLIPEIFPYEKEIPDHIIDDAAKKYSLGEILSTFMAMGMFPHPREFQRIVLIQTDNHDALRQMNDPAMVLTPQILDQIAPQMGPMPDYDFGIAADNINPLLGRMLEQFVPHRSYCRPMVAKRIIMIKKAAAGEINSYLTPDRNPPKIIPALVGTIGGIYLAAKLTGSKDLNDLVDTAVANKGKVMAGLAGAVILYEVIRQHNREMNANSKFNYMQNMERQQREQQLMYKQSSVGGAASIALPILGAYLWRGKAINQMQKGEDPGAIGTFVTKNPMLAGLGIASFTNPTLRKAIYGGIFKGKGAQPAAEAVENVTKGTGKVPWKKILLPTASIAAPIVGSHLIAARTMNKAQEGKPYNKVEEFITKHPMLTGGAVATAITPALRNFVGDLGKYIVKGASDNTLEIEGLSPMEQDLAICAYWELG